MIKLEESTHTYYDTEDSSRTFISATTILGKYKPKFDSDYHAQRIADRDDRTKEDVLAEWKFINDTANEYGTNFHSIFERYLETYSRLYIPRDVFEREAIREFVECCRKNNLNFYLGNTIRPEIILSLRIDGKDDIAGMTDMLDDVDDFWFDVFDFKTNKEFNYFNKYEESLFFPVDFLKNCEYDLYTLQISLYAYMYEKETGKKFRQGGLFYWDKELKTFTYIPITYQKRTIEQLITHYTLTYN